MSSPCFLRVADAKAAGAEAVLHCGDLVAPSTLHCLEKYGLPVHVIHGNNTGDLYALTRLAHKPGGVIRFHGMDAGIELAGKRIFLVHYPHYAHALAATGDWDLVCCGHSHEVAIGGTRGGRILALELDILSEERDDTFDLGSRAGKRDDLAEFTPDRRVEPGIQTPPRFPIHERVAGAKLDHGDLELPPELAEVVDLSVHDHRDGLVFIGHWLRGFGPQVDDRQSAMTEHAEAIGAQAVVIRTAVHHRVAHAPDRLGLWHRLLIDR